MRQMESEGKGRKVIVIGGGCGGLFTAALLAKKSFRVTVIEKNAAIGGGLSTFRRGGIAFQPGMHIIGGLPDTADLQRNLPDALSYDEMYSGTSVQLNARKTSQNNFVSEQGNTLERVFSELGINAEVRNCPRRMVVISDSSVRDIPVTEGAVVEMLGKEFPAEKKGIETYYRRIREIYNSVPMLNPVPMINPAPNTPATASCTTSSDCLHLHNHVGDTLYNTEYNTEYNTDTDNTSQKPEDKANETDLKDNGSNRTKEFHSDELLSADSFIEQYISDPKLKAILGSLNLLTGSEVGITPAYAHAIINELYTRQFAYFPNGTEDIVRQLIEIIENAGGEVISKTTVRCLHFGTTDNGKRRVTAVETSDGSLHTADIYISSISPALLSEISGEKGAFSKIQRKRIASLRDGFSMFTVYAKVKADSPIPEGATFCFPDYDSVWRQGSLYNGDWLHGALFVRFGEQLTAMAAMPFSEVERWENGRDKEYRRWKEDQTARIMELLYKSLPCFDSSITNSSSNSLDSSTIKANNDRHDNSTINSNNDRLDSSTIKATVLCSASPLSIRDWLGTRHGSAYGFSIDCHNPLQSRFSAETKATNLFLTGQNLFLHGLCGTVMSAVTTASAVESSEQR